MVTISTEDLVAVAAVEAIRGGEVDELAELLAEHGWLATAWIADNEGGGTRSLLHVATDWPGHFPNVAAVIGVLVEAGSDVDARFRGPGPQETPLHWAASSDDVAALDALLDAGADIEAPGAVLGGGSPLADATGFGQWQVANRLVARGANPRLADAATLGLLERVREMLDQQPSTEQISRAFWGACHGGRLRCAQLLLEHGAELDWLPPWDRLTPLDAALAGRAGELVDWLRERGAQSAIPE